MNMHAVPMNDSESNNRCPKPHMAKGMINNDRINQPLAYRLSKGSGEFNITASSLLITMNPSFDNGKFFEN